MLYLEVLKERRVEGRRVVKKRVVKKRVEGNDCLPPYLDVFKIKGEGNS